MLIVRMAEGSRHSDRCVHALLPCQGNPQCHFRLCRDRARSLRDNLFGTLHCNVSDEFERNQFVEREFDCVLAAGFADSSPNSLRSFSNCSRMAFWLPRIVSWMRRNEVLHLRFKPTSESGPERSWRRETLCPRCHQEIHVAIKSVQNRANTVTNTAFLELGKR